MIVTSYLFPEGKFSLPRLRGVLQALGDDKHRLVIDLSCRQKGSSWFVAMNKWQTITDLEVNEGKPAVKHCLTVNCLIDSADIRQLASRCWSRIAPNFWYMPQTMKACKEALMRSWSRLCRTGVPYQLHTLVAAGVWTI